MQGFVHGLLIPVIFMSLEEKIASLEPEIRAQVEDYVDFLLSKSSGPDTSTMFSHHCDDDIEPEHSCGFSPLVVNMQDRQDAHDKVRDPAGIPGIIMAEEKPLTDGMDSIDFADINSRFGHVPREEGEKKESESRRRSLDWM
ncbi:MAG: hypothetical protein BWY05_00519 [Euryarchaeota archaeon ADurb.Bin165]|jgi:hypothetical protein|nr:MAG: hypothetical protein BWY05_00519 [Euryarchaeota archaeon ADurb.Bin165]